MPEKTSHSFLYNFQNANPSGIESVTSGREKENDDLSDLFAYDDDDDESFSFKKHLENSNYITFASSTQINECFFNYSENFLSSGMYASYTLTFRYLIFQAIRV